MSKTIYINLPVTDLAAATRFYEAIGCEKNEQFSDHQSSSMVWSDTITFQLLANDYFATFTPKKIADAHATSEVLLALTRDSREKVDAIVEAATSAATQPAYPAQGLTSRNEEQDDAAPEFSHEDDGESIPTSTHVGPH